MRKLIILIILTMMLSVVSIAAEKPEKITFIHYKGGKIKSFDAKGKPTTSVCYKLLGAKWMTLPVNYVINPTNKDGLDETFVTGAIFKSAEEWDGHTNKELFNNQFIINYTADWDDVSPDYRNEYSFGTYPQSNVIAVTNIWGYFGGTKGNRRIIEYDVLFNNYWTWGDATINSGVMDLQNIATHETGHGIGLADLYNTCVYETMYGYSNYGDISKRDLYDGDIAGLVSLY